MIMKPLARSKDIVVQPSGDETLVYDLDTNKAICLNETSAFIWQNCNGKNDIQSIQTIVEKKFGELVSEDFVKFAIDQLKNENLIENGDEVNIVFNTTNRREVIKKIALGSMVALPLVASLTAPKAAHAASACTAPPGNTNLCACNMAAGAADVGMACTTTGFNNCPAGCTPTFAQQGNAVCTCA